MKTKMKRKTALIGALSLMLMNLISCGNNPAADAPDADDTIPVTVTGAVNYDITVEPKLDTAHNVGVLSLLNMPENTLANTRLDLSKAMKYLYQQGIMQIISGDPIEIIDEKGIAFPQYYDTLDAMIMGLESGSLVSVELPDSVAKYVISRNNRLARRLSYNTQNADELAQLVYTRICSGFSFLMLEGRTDLCAEFNKAIDEMKNDGTLDKLKKTHIDDVIAGNQPEAVKFEKTDGETVKVAVTGSLPPLDYVAPDGTPAGYNTAILAEIGRRIGKNIELVQVDSIGRATALSSGAVDVVFWTIGNGEPEWGNTEAEITAYKEKIREKFTDEQNKLLDSIFSFSVPVDELVRRDMPAGTINTHSYYIDPVNEIILK